MLFNNILSDLPSFKLRTAKDSDYEYIDLSECELFEKSEVIFDNSQFCMDTSRVCQLVLKEKVEQRQFGLVRDQGILLKF